MDVVKEYEDVDVIKRVGNFLRNDTMKVMEDIYAQQIEFDAIYSQSDSMLVGVREVQAKLGLDKGGIAVGIDYIQEAKDAILEGKQTATFLYPTVAKEGIEVIVDLINGKEVAKDITVPTKLITIDNVKEVAPIF